MPRRVLPRYYGLAFRFVARLLANLPRLIFFRHVKLADFYVDALQMKRSLPPARRRLRAFVSNTQPHLSGAPCYSNIVYASPTHGDSTMRKRRSLLFVRRRDRAKDFNDCNHEEAEFQRAR